MRIIFYYIVLYSFLFIFVLNTKIIDSLMLNLLLIIGIIYSLNNIIKESKKIN